MMSTTPASSSSVPSSISSTSVGPNVASCCPQEKWQYERCFQKWYNAEYLTGKSNDLSGCQTLFNTYRACVIVRRTTDRVNYGRNMEINVTPICLDRLGNILTSPSSICVLSPSFSRKAHYESNEPEFLVQAGAASDELLKSDGHAPFNTKYPNVEKKLAAAAAAANNTEKK